MADPVVLPIALSTTLACLALNIWSDARIGKARQLVKRGRADAAAILAARQSAAAAFRGNCLFFLMLLSLLELAGVGAGLLAPASIVFSTARGVLIAAGDDADDRLARWFAVTATLLAQALLVIGGVTLTLGHGPPFLG